MKRQINQPSIMAFLALMFIITACNMGMIPKPPVPGDTDPYEQPIGGGGSGGVEEPHELSGNANIRAVSGEGTNKLFGLYIGGMPALKNDTSPDDTTTISLSGNKPTMGKDRKVVVIVEDPDVRSVEFGITSGNETVSGQPIVLTNVTDIGDVEWKPMTRDNQYKTSDTDKRIWTAPLGIDAPAKSTIREVYVRITAEDGATQNTYRYLQYISATVSNGITRGEMSALNIGGTTVISVVSSNATVATGQKIGAPSGWWNKTTAPDFELGEVKLPLTHTSALNVTFNNGSAGSPTVSYAKISESDWLSLKEDSIVNFTQIGSNVTVTNGTVSDGIADGDYIIIRMNADTSNTTYGGLFTHYIIKVNVEIPTYTVTFDKNGGTTDASPASIKVIPPATTVNALPTTNPTRAGYKFDGWNTAANGSGDSFTAATPVTADKTVYAKWTPYVLTINYNSGGGTGSNPTSPTSAAYGTNVTMPANPYTNAGKNFAGWTVSGTGSTSGTYNAGASVAVSALSTAIANGDASITLTATWSDEPVVKSSNANIRGGKTTTHIDASTTAKYGLYLAGMPGVKNGVPQSTTSGFTDNAITIVANLTTGNPSNNRSVVVIVEDEKVAKVEFGMNTAAATLSTSGPPATGASAFRELTKTDKDDDGNTVTTSETAGKRWVGKITDPTPSASGNLRGVFVRITAEDGTQQVYRYVQYYSSSSSGNAPRGELTSLKIGGKDVITNGSAVSPATKGTFAGWWNRTVAPEFTPGQVQLTTAGNLAVIANFNNSDLLNIQCAKIPAADWPLKDGYTPSFSATSANNTTITVNDVAFGDYILIRMNAKTDAGSNYSSLYSHYIIKVVQ